MHHLSNLYVRRTDNKEDEENLRTKARHENPKKPEGGKKGQHATTADVYIC